MSEKIVSLVPLPNGGVIFLLECEALKPEKVKEHNDRMVQKLLKTITVLGKKLDNPKLDRVPPELVQQWREDFAEAFDHHSYFSTYLGYPDAP